MAINLNFTGTGGIIEGNLGTSNVNVNLDAPFYLDGTDDFFHVAHHADFDATNLGAKFTMSAWVYVDSNTSGDNVCIIAKNGTSGADAVRPYVLFYSHSNQIFRVYIGDGSSATVFDSNTITEDVWHHVAVTYNDADDDIKMYIDGQSSGTGFTENLSYTRQLSTASSGDKSLSIGGLNTNDGGGSNFFKGYISDVRFYSDDLNASEVKVLASKINGDINLGAGSTNLVAHWSLLNGSVNDAENATKGDSSTDHDLTPVGSPAQDYDKFSVDVYDGSDTRTTGTFTVTQGKVEGLALSSLVFDGDDRVEVGTNSSLSFTNNMTFAAWIRPDTVSGEQYIISRGVTDNASSQYSFGLNSQQIRLKKENIGNFDNGTNVVAADVWSHVAITVSSSGGLTFYHNGVNVGTDSNTTNCNSSSGAFFIGRRWDGLNGFDGDIKEVKIFDYVKSAEQVASLYSNTYPQTPKHYWKLDEGSVSGTAINNGTVSGFDGSFGGFAGTSTSGAVNGTLDLDGTLTIAANGTLSAPRGTLELAGTNVKNLGAFTHNSGTVKFNQTGNNTINNDDAANNTVFHNVISSPGGRTRFYNSCTIENALTHTSGTALQLDGGRNITLTMGTATSAGSIDITAGEFFRIYPSASTNTVAAANSLFPCVVTGADWSWSDGAGTINLSGLDFQYDITTGTNGSDNGTIILTGDCEFDGFTVSNGDKLDLGGQRAVFSGNLSNQSTGSGNGVDYDGMIYFTGSGRMDSDGASENLDKLTLVQQGTSTLDADFAGDNLIKTFFYNQPSVTQKNHRGAIQTIIGCGTATCGTGNSPDYTNLTVATSGTLDGSSSTLTVAGDFTTSGGLLGASCLSLDSSNTEYAEVADHADLDFPFNNNKITIECWFKTSTTDAHQYLFDRRNGQDVFYMYIDHGGNHVRGRIFTSGTTSEIRGTSTVNDGKWHHAALVYDGAHSGSTTTAAHKLYIDGKLEAEELASGAIYSGTIPLRFGSRYSNEHFLNGEMDEIRVFAAAKTAAQIREDMFKDVGTSLTHFNTLATSSSTGLVGRWGANEGTGSALSCSNSNLNGVIYDYNGGSPAAYTDAWAGAGTFSYANLDTKLKMTGTGGKLTWSQNENVGSLEITGTTTLEDIHGNNGYLQINGELNVNGTLSATSTERLIFNSSSDRIFVPQALILDGTNDYVDCGTSTDYDFTTDFAISCWAKNDLSSTSGGSREHLISKYAGSDNERCYRLYVMGSQVRFAVGGLNGVSANTVDMGFSLPSSHHLNLWNHYAAIFDSGKLYIYVNGVQVAYQDAVSTLTEVHVRNSRKVNIGSYQDGASNSWNGQIADVKLYSDNMLSTTGSSSASTTMVTNATQINPNDATTDNLISHWKLDTAAGTSSTTATNYGTGGNNGTVTNSVAAPWIGNRTNALAGLYTLEAFHGSGTVNLPACTTPRIICNDGGTSKAAGDLTLTQKLEVNTNTTFEGNGNTIAAKEVDVNGSGGTLDLRNSTLDFSVTTVGDTLSIEATGTLLSGNTTITGHPSQQTPAIFPDDGNFEVVGDVSNLKIMSDGDLTVVGSVTNCLLQTDEANIRQWHHTLDTQQLLDADEAGDDDLRLTKPALDNALELMTR